MTTPLHNLKIKNKVATSDPCDQLRIGSVLLIKKSTIVDSHSKGKVLAIDIWGDSIKVYSLQIKTLEPMYVETQTGEQANIGDIGHVPISGPTLETWEFEVIGQEVVTDEELEGYKVWKSDEKGGAF